jgi:hypothetical protein
VGVDATFSHEGQDLAHAFERRRGQHVCSELHEVRQCSIFANNEQSLPEAFEQRADLLQRRMRARGEHEEFPCPREVRVPEHWRSHIILAMPRMLLGEAAGYRRANRARRNVDRIRGENGRQTLRPERDGGKRIVIGKGSHDHVALGKVGKVPGGASPSQSPRSLRFSVIGEYLVAVFDEIDCKSVSHMAETDHTDTSENEAAERLTLEVVGHVEI